MLAPNLYTDKPKAYERGTDHYFCLITWLSLVEIETIPRFKPAQTARSDPCTPLADIPETTNDTTIAQEFALSDTTDSLGEYYLLLFFV